MLNDDSIGRQVNVALCLSWLLAYTYFHHRSSHDPSSFFFRGREAYEPVYSAVREREADAFLSSFYASHPTSSSSDPHEGHNAYAGGAPEYCVGIPSLRREKDNFLPRTLASLLDSLQPPERSSTHVIVLLSDDDPRTHPAYAQPWLSLADTVLVRAPAEELGYTTIPPVKGAGRAEHMRRDHAALAHACRLLDASYFILIEDDVIASRNWLAQLSSSIALLDSNSPRDWLYLRLFYSETYLGWNTEEWPLYAAHIGLLYALLSPVVYAMVRRRRDHRALMVAVLGIWLPLFIMLYFMAGRLTVQPLSPGLHEMPRYGCCSQGLALPRRHLPVLEDVLVQNRYDLPGDSSIDALAEEEGLAKWAVVPSLLQHVGVRGSSATGAVRKSTWNFSFERVYT